jgi:hypothetical protein
MMLVLASKLGLLSAAFVLGSMMFFSAVMAPLVFTQLEPATAGRFIRRVFPWYYLAVAAGGLVAALGLGVARPLEAAAMAAVGGLAIFSRQLLMPAINRARDAELAGNAAAGTRFQRLHRLSVAINVLQVAAVAAVIFRLG